MHGNQTTRVRSPILLLVPALLSVAALPACVRTQHVAVPGPGHPASAESASVAFVRPENLFVQAPSPDQGGSQPVMHTPGMEHHDSGDRGLTVFTCPMHPDVRSDHPGTCPKCGMQLIPSKVSDKPHKHGGAP